MSVGARGTGLKPLFLYHCTSESSPVAADVKSFRALRSPTLCTGFLLKTCTQPAWPQWTMTSPFASRRAFNIGVSASCTAKNSSYES